eukprot:g18024.t1
MDVEVISVDDEDEEIFSQEAQEQQLPVSVSTVVDLVDLTRTKSSASTAEADPVATFEQEYHVLRSAAEGFDPPLEAIAELLLRHPQHWWCRYPDAMTVMLMALEGGSATTMATATSDGHGSSSGINTTGVDIVWQTASRQLSACKRCLVGYHAAQDRSFSGFLAEEEEDRTTEAGEKFRAAVLAQDSARLQRSFRSAGNNVSAAAGGARAASTALEVEVRHAFWEVLSYSQLLEDGGIEAVFLEALGKVIRSGPEAFAGEEWDNQYLPGVYALLVHRDASTRAWAQSMARRAGRIRTEEYLEVLSPVVDRWVPVLEQGLNVSSEEPAAMAAGSDFVDKERLHWSGLHVALQLLEPSAASLLVYSFPSLLDLTLQKFDDGPECRVVPVYLQVCGCLAALLRLLGTGVWEYSSREPLEVLDTIERQTRHDGYGGGAAATGFAPGSRAQSRQLPNEAVHKKVLETLPMLVASAPAPSASISGRVGGSEKAGSRGSDSSVTPPSLADAALGFLSTEIATLSTGGHAPGDQGALTRRRMALTRAFLGVLETCYDGGGSEAMNGGDDDPLDPEGWPWNTAVAATTAEAEDAADGGVSRWWHPSWPVLSLASWGPRLADIAGDRRSGGGNGSTSSGGASALVVDRAARVVELVLRQHAGAAWRDALSALRPPLGLSWGGGSKVHGDAGGREEEEEEKVAVLPLCGPLLERICLELPLMDLPVRVHAAVFAAHGWLSLLPCGESAIRAAEGGGGGAQAARVLARLHSGVLSQFLKLFVPYVQGLTTTVKQRGASVSPVLLPHVAPFIFQALLAAVPAARSALEELVSCSVFPRDPIGVGVTMSMSTSMAKGPKKGDLRPLLRRLPQDCARACFLAVPQALGAMAAAGPHLCLKSWGPLFQAIGVLGCTVLLPSADGAPSHSSDSSNSGEGGRGGSAGAGMAQTLAAGNDDGGEGAEEGEEDGELWEALEAVWEFIFLQVLPEALPALREQHASRLEEALRALFGSLEGLWPLLTGPVPRHRRPRLADGFYSSRPLWLRPLLAWVSEPWLPVAAREAAAAFVQRSLLPFLCVPSSSSSSSEAIGRSGGSSSRARSGKKVRLVGNKFCVVEEDEEEEEEEEEQDVHLTAGGGGRFLGRNSGGSDEERKEERKVLSNLRSAAAAVGGVGSSLPAEGPPPPPPTPPVGGRGRDAVGPAAPENPFARPAERAAGSSSSSGAGSGAGDRSDWSQTPWERRLGAGSTSSRSAPAGGAGPEASFDQFEFTRVSGTAGPPLVFSAIGRANRGDRGSAARRESVARPSVSSTEERGTGGARTGFAGAAAAAAAAVALDGARSGGKSFVTAAEAAAARSLRAKTAASRPRGSVVQRWREMQRKEMAESGTAPYSASAGSPARSRTKTKQQQQQQQQQADRRAQAGAGRGGTATDKATATDAMATRTDSNSAEAKAAFAAAARAAAGRADGAPDGGTRAPDGRPSATVTVALDPAAFAETSSMELHRLVLSSWTVSELTDAQRSQRQGCGGGGGDFQGGGDARRDRRLLSSLWLSKVPTHFQSVEQYVEIFRSLVLEEIFATLVAGLGGSTDGRGRGGGGSGGSETLRVAAFVESGNGGFSHVTLVASDGGGGGGPADGGATSPRFVHDDVLLLSLVRPAPATSGGDAVVDSPAISCLGIFEKERRGSIRGPAGNLDGGKPSVRAKLLFRRPAAAAMGGYRDRGRGSTTDVRTGIIPKKAKAKAALVGLCGRDEEEPGEAGETAGQSEAMAILRALREPGTEVRVTRLEGLSTSTREFAALEAVGSTSLLHHLLQATPDPTLVPVPAAPVRPGSNPNTANPARTANLGPPHPVDEASFTDACKRLASVEDSFSRAPDGGNRNGNGNGNGEVNCENDRWSGLGGGRAESGGGDAAVDALAPAELLMRSLRCLASFRVTPELLTSHGRATAKRLKGLSKSEAWGPVVRGAAARLLRAWRSTVNDGGSSSASNGTSAASAPGTRVPHNSNSEEKQRIGGEGEGDGAVGAAAAAVSERGSKATSKRPQERGPQERDKEEEKEKGKERRERENMDDGDDDEDDISSQKNKTAALPLSSDGGADARRPAKGGRAVHANPQSPPRPKRPSLVPAALWDRLSHEFNASQLTAIWAAAASQQEARQERAASAAGRTAKQPARVQTRPAAAPAAAATAASYRTVAGGIVLLQGPPGTGKTRTILGVVSAILARREEKEEGVANARTGTEARAGEGCGGAFGGDGGGGGDRGMGNTLAVGARQKRPGVAGRWVAAKTHQRVLVCAPSNGAVDELTQRLALETGGVWDHRGKAVAPRVVRLGRPSEDSAPRVKAVSLEVMVEERVKLHAKSTEARNAETKLREAYAQINEATRALRSGEVGGEATGVSGLGSAENRRHQLNTQIRRLRGDVLVAKQRRRDALRGLEVERGRIRRSLLSNAQIVCSTLSGCGSAPLVEAVSVSRKGFDTVIVDEACQATEPSTLIPLSLGCKRLILVGDPRQLPATVISHRASRLRLEVSLFERLENAGYPVHMLTVQYRMHPEIRAFPSARFYGGRLTDAPCVREKEKSSQSQPGMSTSASISSSTSSSSSSLGPCFPPLLVVDVTSGLERRVGNSYQNQLEAHFVAAFVDRLAAAASGSRHGRGVRVGSGGGMVRVGVITPYRGQVQCIRQELGSSSSGSRWRTGSGGDGGVDVEVSTVDGFQGKEVDVVLFSCVRAPSSASSGHGYGQSNGAGGGGIGFLADQRRMNVAITRARLSLVVLGNARRLSSDSNWRALVEHAASRERVIESRGGDCGAEICARLEARAASAAKRSQNVKGPDGDRRVRRSTPDVGSAHDGGAAAPGDDPQSTKAKRVEAQRGQRGSASGHPQEGDRTADRGSFHRSRDGDIESRRQADDGTGGTGRQRKPARRRSADVEKRASPTPGEDDAEGGWKHAPTRHGMGETASTAGASAVPDPSRRGGGGERPQKRPRMTGSDPARGDFGGSDRSSGGSGGRSTGSATRVPSSMPPDSSKPVNEGFLAGLLGSLTANAEGIASGKDHAFRQGLRGGEDEARKRAAAAPRLGGARFTELSRPREPKQAPAATYAPPTSRNHQSSGRVTTATTLATSSVLGRDKSRRSGDLGPGDHGGRAEPRKRSEGAPIPARQAQRPAAGRGGPPCGNASGSGGAGGGGTKLPASRSPGGRAGSGGSGGKVGGAKKGGSGACGGSSVAGMGVMDILKAMDDSWGSGTKKK